MSWSNTIFLHGDKEELLEVLEEVYGKTKDGNLITSSDTHVLDIVGVLKRPTNIEDAESEEDYIWEDTSGYHVNLRVVGEFPSEATYPLADFQVFPTTAKQDFF